MMNFSVSISCGVVRWSYSGHMMLTWHQCYKLFWLVKYTLESYNSLITLTSQCLRGVLYKTFCNILMLIHKIEKTNLWYSTTPMIMHTCPHGVCKWFCEYQPRVLKLLFQISLIKLTPRCLQGVIYKQFMIFLWFFTSIQTPPVITYPCPHKNCK